MNIGYTKVISSITGKTLYDYLSRAVIYIIYQHASYHKYHMTLVQLGYDVIFIEVQHH